jgi:hypothetical protein
MRQSIETKYLGPTNSRGSRVKAAASGGASITLPWAYDVGSEQNHKRAAEALCRKLGWNGTYSGGSTKGGYVFVYSTESDYVSERVFNHYGYGPK